MTVADIAFGFILAARLINIIMRLELRAEAREEERRRIEAPDPRRRPPGEPLHWSERQALEMRPREGDAAERRRARQALRTARYRGMGRRSAGRLPRGRGPDRGAAGTGSCPLGRAN